MEKLSGTEIIFVACLGLIPISFLGIKVLKRLAGIVLEKTGPREITTQDLDRREVKK